jgi:hypothetical protein
MRYPVPPRTPERNGTTNNKDRVDQVLLGRMYLAHYRNNGTLSRRADLLRLASLLALAFVIDLGFWLR